MTKPQNIIPLAQAAIQYAKAVAYTAHCKEALKAGYLAWRKETGSAEYIERGSTQWKAMMHATAGEYQQLRNAKSRQYRALHKLLAQAKSWEGAL